ncbi:MAG: hypothetical protein KY459_10920 [Acidobacteria bacterium]|nr:hypothetical protein [Acidobacteriota bacterium]
MRSERATGTVLLLLPLILAALFVALPATSQPSSSGAIRDYALELDIRPIGDSQILDKLGKARLTVFPQGVHFDSAWLDGYSKRGSKNVILIKPIARLYALMPLDGFRHVVRGMANESGELIPNLQKLTVERPVAGRINRLPAERHRIRLSEKAWIDVWISTTIPENSQLRVLQREILGAISNQAAPLADQIRGVPLFIQMNSPDHPNETILAVRALRRSSAGSGKMLQVGPFYLRASAAERLWRD